MKVIKNNCIEKIEIIEENKSLQIECDYCTSELEITKEDAHIGSCGAAFVTCPCCGEEIMVDEFDGITLTVDNIKFPVHFCRTNRNLRNVSAINSDEIVKYIKRGIEYFRKNKNEFDWYTSCGDLFLNIHRFSGDEEYSVVVAQDFYETSIPFESVDYE